MSCDKTSAAGHGDPKRCPYADSWALTLDGVPALLLQSCQEFRLLLCCGPAILGYLLHWSTMAHRQRLIPDSGREKRHKAEVHTSLLLTPPLPELGHGATPTCKGRQEDLEAHLQIRGSLRREEGWESPANLQYWCSGSKTIEILAYPLAKGHCSSLWAPPPTSSVPVPMDFP